MFSSQLSKQNQAKITNKQTNKPTKGCMRTILFFGEPGSHSHIRKEGIFWGVLFCPSPPNITLHPTHFSSLPPRLVTQIRGRTAGVFSSPPPALRSSVSRHEFGLFLPSLTCVESLISPAHHLQTIKRCFRTRNACFGNTTPKFLSDVVFCVGVCATPLRPGNMVLV